MRVLIFMAGFFPGRKYGGPPVSVNNYCSLLREELDCYIVTLNHDMNEVIPYNTIKEGWNNKGNAKVLYLPDEEFGYKRFKSIVKEIKPSYIYLQGLFQKCVLPCLRLAKKYHINVVLAPRGELCAGAFKKKYKKIPYILLLRFLNLVKTVEYQSTSDEETKAIANYLNAGKDRIHLLSNIPSIPNTIIGGKEKIVNFGRFVFVSRIVNKKNLLSAINYFKTIKGRAEFDIYGPKEDPIYWHICEDAIKLLPESITVTYKGIVSHEEIHDIISQYDAFLFPTYSENYGHVIAEALYSGCIPIISDQTPWTDINEVGAGFAFPLDSETSFVQAIQSIINMDNAEYNEMQQKILPYLSRKQDLNCIKEQYLQVFK